MNDFLLSTIIEDIAELRAIAQWFREGNRIENADFLLRLAARYEILSGAYSTAIRGDIATAEKLPESQLKTLFSERRKSEQ
jgi:hypothetical protein